MGAPLPYRRFRNAGFPRAQKRKHAADDSDYRQAGGPQQTSIAVRRKKTCVATRARTLGREFPNDMRASMAELRGLSTEIFIPLKATARRGHERENKPGLQRYSLAIRLNDSSD
jgi:hypothetical protein